MQDEILDVVDAEDRVIGQARRDEIHANGRLHRAVHIFVFNSLGELLLQRRSPSKDTFPRCYTSSASGHVDAGEDYETCARRELREELGLAGPLTFLTKLSATPELALEHSALFCLRTDAAPTPDPAEISELRSEPLAEIVRMTTQQPGEFATPFLVLFRWYCENVGDLPAANRG